MDIARLRSHPILSRQIRPDVGIRIVGDAIIICSSLSVGLVLGLFAAPPWDPMSSAEAVNRVGGFSGFVALLVRGAPLMVLLTIGLFFTNRVYTRTRFYRASSKVPRLLQSITLAYLIFWLVTYIVPGFLPIPSAALICAWAVTSLTAIGARFWPKMRARFLALDESATLKVPTARPNKLRTVLVIGGAGYIGSVLCRQLLGRGFQVRVLDALLYGDQAIRELAETPTFELIDGDSRDITSLVNSMRGVDAVVHLGEIVGDPACALDEQVTLEINLAATRMAAEVAKGFGVQRFVYASSCSVYGASEGVVDELSELHPVSLYARTKIGAEHVLLGLHGKDFHPVIVRLATVYGLSPRPRFDLVVNKLAAEACVDGQVTVHGGSQWRPFVHVADVARALILCLEKPLDLVDGQTFNLGSDTQNLTIGDIGTLIQSILPRTQVHTVASGVDQRNYRVSFSKIRDELDFQTRMSVSDGIREIAAALTTGAIVAYRDPRHDNAQFLRTDYGSHRVRSVHPAPLYRPDPAAFSQLLLPETKIMPSAADEATYERKAAAVLS